MKTLSVLENNFQRESTISGNEFESAVAIELADLHDLDEHEITKITLPAIGVELDYLILTDEGLEAGEAKGGKPGPNKRPGAERTDSVKKAICNGALLQHFLPNLKFVVYFSSPPKQNSASDAMIRTALEAGFISEVRYLNIYTSSN